MPPQTLVAFGLAVLAVLAIAWYAYRSVEDSARATERVTHTLAVTEQLEATISSLKDAETGQRGFLLTGTEAYLAPYNAAISALAGQLKALRSLTADNPAQLQRIETLEETTRQKLEELAQTIALRRSGDAEGALVVMRSDRGRMVMVRARALVEEMRTNERSLLTERQAEAQRAAMLFYTVTGIGSALLLVLIGAAAWMTARDHRERESQAWVRAGQMGLSASVQGDQRLDAMGDSAVAFLADYLGAQVAALYVAEHGGRLRRIAGYAMPPVDEAGSDAKRVHPGDGLLGQALKDNRAMHVKDLPAGYSKVVSATGQGEPRELLIAPASVDGKVQAVVELGFFRRVTQADRELLDRASETLGVAVRSSKDRTRLEELLEETQRQGEELQAQQEELRVSNEELEEQARALKESQAQLEHQQTELEQINSQLEEQTQLLENQKEELSNAQEDLSARAADLERSNQYKSEFLANMSHELRTPLNSSLILAKLLADNRDGNLTGEQIKFAQTISSAGNDLLALINDILDLSKIESGKVELSIEPVGIRRTVESLMRSLQPLAQDKGLAFGSTVDEATPAMIETDAQRLGQILKNLISNALKFTPRGEVSLKVAPGAAGMVDFAVSDSGIGIPAHQQELIFEAFRQADGSTHRKFGGTGLGLSISRDLARLLGGDIAVRSAPGQGSVFTLSLPRVQTAGDAATRQPAPHHASPLRQSSPFGAAEVAASGQARAAQIRVGSPPPSPARRIGQPLASVNATGALPLPGPAAMDDDRDALRPGARLILVIEDDVRFAAILRGVAREMEFQCIVTHTATDGLHAAFAYHPSAILLDMNLPDLSGLGVLDQLKRNPDTRHIPVHVVSVADYSHEARELGAIGYALKPVKREELVSALRRLEAKFSQGMHRVLVVEDDQRQRESMRQLLANSEVQITDVDSAGEALAQLQANTFDCMVMDLNLPDLSGYELLEKMAEQDEVSFPPVIVYTGRSLTRDEETRLRRYSKSIIIKDARSPERLLDEVTLFLHQVEAKLPAESQRMLKAARDRDASLEGRRILVVEDDVRNIFALSSVLEPKGAKVEIARNGHEAIDALARSLEAGANSIDLVLMDIMMPEMDGITAMREIRKRGEWKKLPIIALTAKAMKDDQEKCLQAGANDYIAKPLDVEKLLSLIRVWMPK
ncbi:response regulator [soil metagenome]